MHRKDFLRALGLASAAAILPVFKSQARAAMITPAQPNRCVRAVHLTDIHIETTDRAEYGFRAALRSIRQLTDKPDFLLNGGDAIMNEITENPESLSAEWGLFHSILKEENELPVYHCIGNHDLKNFILPDASHSQAKQYALQQYGLQKPYYHFKQNEWHFLVLDSIHGHTTFPGYYGKIDDEQMTWLRQELASIPAKEFVCIMSHIPILAICTLFDGSGVKHRQWNVPDNSLHADAAALRDLFFQYPNIRCCLSGHIHLVDHVNYLGIDYYCNGAVCGSWWKGKHQQFAPSYSVMNFYDDGSTERELVYYQWEKAV